MAEEASAPARRRRAATQTDVAREVGVSRTLVSFAFRGEPGVSSETRDAIFAAAERIGYRHNVVAARLASKKNNTLGLYMLDLRNEVYADVFDGIRDALRESKHHLVLSVSRTMRGVDDPEAIEALVAARVGVVIAATFIDPDDDVRRLSQTVPVVSTVRRIAGVDSVYSDDRAGARLATRHLLELGHRDIVHVAGPPHEGLEARRLAYEETMAEAGALPRVAIAEDYTGRGAAIAIEREIQQRGVPTAVFANNDQAALGVREELMRRGLSVPGDVSIVGYDNTRAARLTGIELTTVDLHAFELGQEAGRVALDRLRDPEAPVVDRVSVPSLVLRATSAPPPKR